MPKFKDLTGQRFGRLTVLPEHEKRLSTYGSNEYMYWLCKCDCGTEKWVANYLLLNGKTKSCGCYARECCTHKRGVRNDLSGQRFGYLTVLPQYRIMTRGKTQYTEWLCRCDCGTEKWVSSSNLKGGGVRSCGCRRYELNYEKQHMINSYDLDSFDYGICFLQNGKQVLFDKEDYDKIKPFYWYTKRRTNYILCDAPRGLGYNRETVYLHRFVMGIGFEKFSYDKVVDHVNGDPLDNRKCNLRITSQLNNMANQNRRTNTKTGIPGITVEQKTGGYIVRVGRGMERVYGGYFMNLEDAIARNNELRNELYGDYSYTNSQKISKENKLHG